MKLFKTNDLGTITERQSYFGFLLPSAHGDYVSQAS